MEVSMRLTDDEVQNAQLEILIKIQAMQRTTLSLMCEKFAIPGEANTLFDEMISECNIYAHQIFEDLYARRGSLDLKDIFPK